jgi:hypothetical protein
LQFAVQDRKPALTAGLRLLLAERRAACDTGCLAHRIGRVAIRACDAFQPFRKFMGCACGLRGTFHRLPNGFGELQILEVLGDIVDAAQQRERIFQCGQRAPAQAGGGAHPGLLAQFDHHAIGRVFNCDGQRGLSA